jgi:integrase
MRKDFYLFKRSRKSGKPVYYVQFPGESGARSTAISTGQTAKTAAEHWARDFLRKGGSLPTQGRLTFAQFAEKWWIYEECPYIKGRTARGFHISRGYARVRRSYLERYLLPRFGKLRLTEITPAMIEEWLMGMMDAGRLTTSTCNRCLGTLHIMLAQAVKMGHLQVSPASPIEQLKENPKPRGILPMEMVRRLFAPETAVEVWGDARHFTANLLAASTGMRLGEVQGLQVQHVHPGWVNVVHSWDDTHGLTRPKWGSGGEIPIPTKTSEALQGLIEHSPYQDPDHRVFWGKNGYKALTKTTLLGGLRRALERVGIPLDEQKEQNYVFHSWGHGFNTMLRGKIPDEQLRRVTRHKSLKMSDRYDHVGVENLKDVAKVQENLFS